MFSFTPAKIEITANSSKVPKERGQMRIDFFARTDFYLLENVSFSVSSEDITIIEISPSNSITLDENGISGYAIIRLDRVDTLYKVYLNALRNGEIEGSTYFYFRNEQGNALKLTEDQYKRFSEEKKQMWLNSEAEENAHIDLETLRAKGLQIAVENWPKDGIKFIPLENNIGDTLEIMDNSLYEIKVAEEAIQDPAYKDIVKIEIEPPNGGISYYANFTTSEEIASQNFCVNLLANLKVIAKLYNPYENKFIEWISNPINAIIEYQGYVLNSITGDCEVKMFAKEITIQGQYVKYDNLIEGIGYALVNVPPNGNYTLKGIRFNTYNDKIKAGACHMQDDPTSGDPACWGEYPVWVSGSENVYYWQEGGWGSNAMIQNTRCAYGSTIPECQGFTESPQDPLKLKKYVALVNCKNYTLDEDIRVEKFPLYDDMIKINNFWSTNGFGQQYISYRACPWTNMGNNGDFNHFCTPEPIIRIKDTRCFGHSTIYHETGHWLQYKMQNNDLVEEPGSWTPCWEVRLSTAFQEGFADWHKWFVSLGGDVNDNKNELDYPCPHDYTTLYKKKAACTTNFLWDVWDSLNDPVSDSICENYSWDNCGDLINLEAGQLKSWIGHKYEEIDDFIRSFKSPGMPLYEKEDDPDFKCKVCKLQNSHGLLTDDCFSLSCQ